jgi:hypothetical protein
VGSGHERIQNLERSMSVDTQPPVSACALQHAYFQRHLSIKRASLLLKAFNPSRLAHIYTGRRALKGSKRVTTCGDAARPTLPTTLIRRRQLNLTVGGAMNKWRASGPYPELELQCALARTNRAHWTRESSGECATRGGKQREPLVRQVFDGLGAANDRRPCKSGLNVQ